MLLNQFRAKFSEELSAIYPKTEIDAIFFILMEDVLGLQRIEVVMQPNFKIPLEKVSFLNTCLKELYKEVPIQYLLGKTMFYELPFYVNEHTLIPRPETEELVHWVLNEIADFPNQQKSHKVLDIGTGTGCIPIAIKKNSKNTAVFAIDISKEALKIAQKNALLNEVNVGFLEVDILTTKKLDGIFNTSNSQKFDIIISNPPYVRELEKVEIQNNVLKNEPHLALFVTDDNPLIFYKKIADLAKKSLSPKGMLFFEINQYLGKETINMLKEKGFKSIVLRKDVFGNDRMIKASF
ncbi:peptide chain release factor N(5)-glutamine methyltransferase [Tenacibaculum maritimum]|uniref:peptide chain release factor N(5)-glutamine methyltransferase n=1 Tax=Tenacibaculum maritimum TaxID=107401 RepID=UPI0012E489A9|nr:peptide chain release factor N(5)-glutamine methyltransferase [Tenacibaculum maritimum]MCD9561669.1 peptide chain release factor N(5)-glutamine methyltransferase [Tenacibaculum maritimum]MCD9566655.1 peptide chain release factor N(5)-glutamine methyltransferase [Tenacibaculum maritimum]MCD9577805.1 peptide chain release factor N(5)-glutamine methyltransferase [Tenacibaculum maritimum]MCD9597339.1 peptide chain release factor N(5)-glutamine methyltransferase [Tenacibaculum maritimum]MCD96123